MFGSLTSAMTTEICSGFSSRPPCHTTPFPGLGKERSAASEAGTGIDSAEGGKQSWREARLQKTHGKTKTGGMEEAREKNQRIIAGREL